ncbi:MAG: HNH endonuclease [Candidatus Ratteibacteria bacterium]|jgi:hypothetical protein
MTKKERIIKRDGLICCWCGCKLDLNAKFSNDKYATIEHIIPKKWGGGNDISNLGLACRKCNNSGVGEKFKCIPRFGNKRHRRPHVGPKFNWKEYKHEFIKISFNAQGEG